MLEWPVEIWLSWGSVVVTVAIAGVATAGAFVRRTQAPRCSEVDTARPRWEDFAPTVRRIEWSGDATATFARVADAAPVSSHRGGRRDPGARVGPVFVAAPGRGHGGSA